LRAGQTILKGLIEGERQYRVPLFQRPYTWTKVQLDQLWSDILDQYELLSTYEADGGSKPLRSSHFIGSFVLAPLPGMAHGVSSYLIVDGQQRLTTLLLVLAALRDWQKGKDQKAVDRLNQLYLRNEHAEGGDRYKLLPTRLDREAFFAFIDGTAPPSTNSNLEAAYRFFAGQLTKPAPNSDESLDHHRLERVIVERLAVVDITTEEDDNPHRIFESLNATGMSLTQADLLRNFLFMLLPTRGQIVYDQVWYPMEKALGEEHLAGLARVDLQRRGIEVQRDDVYREQQQRLEPMVHDEAAIEAEVRDLAMRGGHYRRLVNPIAEPNRQLRAALMRLRRWGAETTYPLLMHAYDLIERRGATETDLIEALAYIESFLVRRHLVQVPTKQLNRLFVDAIDQLPGDQPLAEAIRFVLSGERRYWATDDQIRQAVRTAPFYLMGRADQRKLILERLEESYGHLEPVNLAAVKLTIEHILPQTLTDEWKVAIRASGDDPDTLSSELGHTLGNLTLTAYNGVLSNSPFERKNQIYGQSNLQLNKALIENVSWGRTEILARADELADRIIQIWPGPIAGAKGAPIGFDWSRIDSAVAAIPKGNWTTYGDLAILGGTSPQSVGHRMSSPALTNGYRVLDSQGRVSPSFKWPDPSDKRDVKDLLEEEGIAFGEDGTADPSQKLNALQLAKLIDYEVEEDELKRLERLFASQQGGNSHIDGQPWLLDGRAWHLGQASPKSWEILLLVVAAAAQVSEGSQPSWKQKYYVSWTNGSRSWMTAHPRKHWVWLSLNRPPFTGEEAASRLGWALVPPGVSPNWTIAGSAQVQASANGSTVWLQLKAASDLEGQTGTVLRSLIGETWKANQPSFV
jgi:alkylated DNA nucleotide flippase Atl1